MKNHLLTDQSSYRKTILSNGVRVLSEEIPYVRSVSIGVWVMVGSRDEQEKTNGVTHLIEHMVFKGTKKRNVRMIAQSLESVGGYLNAFTSKEHTCYYARVLDEHAEKAIDILSDLIINPLFNAKDLEKEKAVILEELKNYEDEPDEIIHDEFDRVLFQPHPLAYNILGTRETLKAFKKPILDSYKNKHYTSDNIIICAAGNISHDKLIDLSLKYFGELKTSKNKHKMVFPKQKRKAITVNIIKPIQQAHICYGTRTFKVNDERRYPLLVLNTILGDGMASRLYQTIRERQGLAYSVYSFANFLTDTGSFGVYLGTDKSKVDISISLIKKELETFIKKPISKAELARTKAQVKGNMVLGLESMSNRMTRLAKGEIYYGEFHTVDSLVEKINKIDSSSVQKVAEDIFDLSNFNLIALLPENS